jgi:signal transduction histidine kinase
MDMRSSRFFQQAPPQLIWGISALAYLEDHSTVIVARDALNDAMSSQISCLPSDFDEFCDAVSIDINQWRKDFETLGSRLWMSRWFNAPPFMRVLREHWFWSWYEIRLLVRGFSDQSSGQLYIECEYFSPVSLPYQALATLDQVILIAGPGIRLTPAASNDHLELAAKKFNSTISRFWKRSPGPESAFKTAPFYSNEQLKRHLTIRPLNARSAIDTLHPNAEKLYQRALPVLMGIAGAGTISEVAKLASLLSTEHTLRDFHNAVDQSEAVEAAISYFIHHISHSDSRSNEAYDIPKGLSRLISHRQDTGLLGWSRYFYESVSLLNGWLARRSYLSLAPQAFAANSDKQLLWSRVCRFIAALFLASEVTIYKYYLADERRYLGAIGGYCDDPGGEEKVSFKFEFMKSAAERADWRSRSASYRAADTNEIYYVEDAHDPRQASRILAPTESKWADWGRSVLSLPIRLNGGVWGVLEFVSRHPNHFGPLLRPKCEEITDVLSSSFLTSSIFETIGKVESYWSDNFSAERGRQTQLCHTLASMFACEALSIFTASLATIEGRKQHFSVTEFGSWISPAVARLANREGALPIDLAEIRSFLDSDTNVQERLTPRAADSTDGIASNSIKYGPRQFIVRLAPNEMNGWSGALVFAVPYPISTEGGWELTAFALAQLVAGVVSTVTSNASWGREARQNLRHEYKRVINELRGLHARLEQPILKLSPEDQRTAKLALADLDLDILSMSRMSDLLMSDVYDRLLHGDLRIVAVKRAKEAFAKGKNPPVNPREAFFSKFLRASDAYPKKQIGVQNSSPGQELLLDIDPIVLSDILGTLADNAVKYSVSGGDIILRFSPSKGGGLRMTISNLAPELTGKEAEHIFDDGFRGRYARQSHPEQGSGRGLGFARKAMQLWNGTLRYNQDPAPGRSARVDGFPVVWHRFTLTFPSEIVLGQTEGHDHG